MDSRSLTSRELYTPSKPISTSSETPSPSSNSETTIDEAAVRHQSTVQLTNPKYAISSHRQPPTASDPGVSLSCVTAPSSHADSLTTGIRVGIHNCSLLDHQPVSNRAPTPVAGSRRRRQKKKIQPRFSINNSPCPLPGVTAATFHLLLRLSIAELLLHASQHT